MPGTATTRMSSRGQVVIPEAIRRKLGLREGMEFVVVGEGDVVVLRQVHPPSMDEFEALIGAARSEARKAGLRRKDLGAAIARVRGRRRGLSSTPTS